MDEWANELVETGPDRGVAEHVRAALSRLLLEDASLLKSDANERSVSHRLALYLEEEFPGWNVDCEYNRDGHEPKRLNLNPKRVQSDDTQGTTVYPDLIVHKRGEPSNLLAIEIKKSNGESKDRDIEKLRALRLELSYCCALFVRFSTGSGGGGISDLLWSSD